MDNIGPALLMMAVFTLPIGIPLFITIRRQRLIRRVERLTDSVERLTGKVNAGEATQAEVHELERQSRELRDLIAPHRQAQA